VLRSTGEPGKASPRRGGGRIDDEFAVAKVGSPSVEVFHENRPMGATDARGLLLIPTLRSNQKNKITVDPAGLPVDAEIESARQVVAPADRAGVLVDFNVRKSTNSALEELDHRFVEICEETRAKVVKQQQEKALIVIDDDVLLLYRHHHPLRKISGMTVPVRKNGASPAKEWRPRHGGKGR